MHKTLKMKRLISAVTASTRSLPAMVCRLLCLNQAWVKTLRIGETLIVSAGEKLDQEAARERRTLAE
jgi:hypothetical protein